jgi:hypothetical protein
MRKLGMREAAQFLFWEYINGIFVAVINTRIGHFRATVSCEILQQDFILVTHHVPKMYRYDLSGSKYKYEGKECAINPIIRRFARKKCQKNYTSSVYYFSVHIIHNDKEGANR